MRVLAFFALVGLAFGDAEAQERPHPEMSATSRVVDFVCVANDGMPPMGYTRLEVFDEAGHVIDLECTCPGGNAWVKGIVSAITIRGAYQIVKITHDTKVGDVQRVVRRFTNEKRAKKMAPGLHRKITSPRAKQASRIGLAASVLFVAEEYTYGKVEKALVSETGSTYGLDLGPDQSGVVLSRANIRKQREACGTLETMQLRF